MNKYEIALEVREKLSADEFGSFLNSWDEYESIQRYGVCSFKDFLKKRIQETHDDEYDRLDDMAQDAELDRMAEMEEQE